MGGDFKERSVRRELFVRPTLSICDVFDKSGALSLMKTCDISESDSDLGMRQGYCSRLHTYFIEQVKLCHNVCGSFPRNIELVSPLMLYDSFCFRCVLRAAQSRASTPELV